MPDNPLDIESRLGWPDDLQVLLRQYPREVWLTHPNLGRLARFWLGIHNGFREHAALLTGSAADFREGRVTPQQFRANFAPRLQVFLSHLEGHHQIEDFQFFPLFGEAEPRLLRGFEVLETDHGTIHGAMDQIVETANALLRTPVDDADKIRTAGDAFAATSERIVRLLGRHLDDEEDLIVPLILERGEDDLGIG